MALSEPRPCVKASPPSSTGLLVAVKELNLSYYIRGTIVFIMIYTHDGNLI